MAEMILFSNGERMGMIREGETFPLPSQRYQRYREAMQEIRRQHQWKNSGTGALFMGNLSGLAEDQEPAVRIGGMALLDGLLYYTAFLGGVGGLYTKDPLNPDAPEGVIVHRQGMNTAGLCWNGASFATTLLEGRERHLGFFTLPRGELTVVTQGETVEAGPSWSRDCQQVWFSSAGWGREAPGGEPVLGPRAICRLDANTMELTEVYAQPGRDCISPQEGEDGSLWFLRRPRREEQEGNTLADIAAAPGKVVRAMGGWLDLFTRRYAGESLRSGGGKAKQKPERDLIIEGNLINAQRALEENQSQGEAYPGIIPRSWELVRLAPGGENPEVVQKGVLAYALAPGGYVFSNGRHILRATGTGKPELLAEEGMVTMLTVERGR
ncbi:MAG: hypothetical protein HFF15_09780 [Angelakisella sp.]|jgi:hypothetical protein|nr:hypothetical protein [Angelakisella sp.]